MTDTENNRNNYHVLGVMSGTSLDGVDLAYCCFDREEGHWNYRILAAETIQYPEEWIQRLSRLEDGSALEFCADGY